MKKTFVWLPLFFLVVCNVAFAQQTTETPAWEVTLATNTTARSTLTVVNRCKKSHEFQIILENVPFLKFAGVNQVKVSGGKSVDVPVVFDTNGIAPGLHTGLVIVLCQTCKSEPTCTQDRERLPVKLTVTGAPNIPPATGTTTTPATTPVPTSSPTTTTTTPTTVSPTTPTTGKKKGPCEEAEDKCEKVRLKAWNLESQAAAARALAKQAREKANELENAAKAAEQKARELTAASKDSEKELERLTDTERGRVYTGYDFRKRKEYEEGVWSDFRSGKITSEQAYQKLEEFHGPEGIDKFQDAERKRLSELKYQAEQATKAAEQAGAAAKAAAAQAAAAEAAATRAEAEAAKARTEYEECVKQIPADCPKPGGLASGAGTGAGTATGRGPSDQGTGVDPTRNGKGPCEDCEDLLRALQDKEAEAAKAQALADEARKQAEGPENAAREAEETAKKAADAAKDPAATRGRIIDHERGRVYTSRDFELQRQANRAAWNDYKGGKIDGQQLQDRWNEINTLDGLDRLQDEDLKDRSKKKFEAEQLAKKAAEARAAADAANAIARAAQEAADKAKADEEAARKAYEECMRKLKEECEKARLAAEKAEADRQAAIAAANRASAQAAANAQAAADLKRRQDAAAALRAQQEAAAAEQARIAREQGAKTAMEHRQYLIDNIRQLNLIPYKGWIEVPGIWEWLPKYLEKPVGDLAEEVGGTQIPTDVLKAIGGLYNIVNILLDPCTGLGARKTVERLEKMTNPKTNRKYTLNEALTKTEQMCVLLRQLKAKVEAENRAKR